MGTKQPPDEAAIHEYNQEFATPEAELRFRKELEIGGVKHVEYKRNRAVIFVSDLFHVSEPFDFPDEVEGPRVNLTLLFGDRASSRRGHDANKRQKVDNDADVACALATSTPAEPDRK